MNSYCKICGELVKEGVTICQECREAVDKLVEERLEGRRYPQKGLWPKKAS